MKVSEHDRTQRFSEFAENHRITVIIPARNEAATVGKIIDELAEKYLHQAKLIHNLVVVDDHSTDQTSSVAARAGATVISRNDPNDPNGKAETILEGIRRFPSDVYVLFDADVSNFDPAWLEILCLGLANPKTLLAKGSYSRPVRTGQTSRERFMEGGRVTELVARPLLSLFFPALAKVAQPLSGEIAFRSTLIEATRLSAGYGFDVGLLIDSYLKFGLDSICEVDLGQRTHRHQDLPSLSYQASQVASTIMFKAGIDIAALPGAGRLVRPNEPDREIPYGSLTSHEISVR